MRVNECACRIVPLPYMEMCIDFLTDMHECQGSEKLGMREVITAVKAASHVQTSLHTGEYIAYSID